MPRITKATFIVLVVTLLASACAVFTHNAIAFLASMDVLPRVMLIGIVIFLLSLPYIGATGPGDPLYLNTRRFILSESNPYYCVGKAATGQGGPHVGRDMIWPLGLIVQGLTSADDQEVRQCLLTLQKTHAGTGFMHEAFNKDDPSKFTRKWFAWANTIFGELILKSYKERPHVLN